jgi:ABC-2 type transport system ATP-binding protein
VIPAVEIVNVARRFGAVQALSGVDLVVEAGEFFGLLGPNGAGKTTLISILAGLVAADTGTARVLGHDVVTDYRNARRRLGVVPQELVFDPFFTVRETLEIQSGYFGIRDNDAWIDEILHHLDLAGRANTNMRALSGGMKRRVLIGQALVHKPPVIVLDEPTAGVDVELRRDMWNLVRGLKANGVTIILTTHYIDEAEEMADRIGVINRGEIILIEEKAELMRKLGQKKLALQLEDAITQIPAGLSGYRLHLSADGCELTYTYDAQDEPGRIITLLKDLADNGIQFKDLQTTQSSLEDIFVSLVGEKK